MNAKLMFFVKVLKEFKFVLYASDVGMRRSYCCIKFYEKIEMSLKILEFECSKRKHWGLVSF